MAESMFGTFDLGSVLTQAEQIKGLRKRNALADLEQSWMQRQQDVMGNPNASPEEFARAGRADIGNALVNSQRFGMERQEFESKQKLDQLNWTAAGLAEVAQNPAAAERWAPEFQRAGILRPDFDWRSLRPEQLRALAQEQLQGMQAALAAFRGPQETGPLESVVGPDGQPVLVPRQSAVGQRPYYKPAAGMRVRSDGQGGFTFEQGEGITGGGDIGPADLTAPIRTKLQETIVNSSNRLDRLNQTLSTYNPEFLRAKGLASALTIKGKDFLGLSISPDQRRYLDEYSQFQSTAATDLSLFLNELSGAAISPQEYQRLASAAPSGKEHSPTEFEGKSKATVKGVTRAIMRANWALSNGIGVRSVEQLAKVMPLESIDRVYEQRANAIWQELGGTPETRQQAIQQANREFGLAR